MTKDFTQYLEETGEVGFVRRVIASLVYVEGLPGAHLEELIAFETGESGQVTALGEHMVEVMAFSKIPIKNGIRAARTGHPIEVLVGEGLQGTIIDPLGRLISPLEFTQTPVHPRTLYAVPPYIRARARITQPCETGVTIVDLMVPLGKGQRELVIGDQKSGKTYFLLRTLLQQIREGSIGIYAAIGKSKLVVRQVQDFLIKTGVKDRVIIVASYAEDPAGIIYLAPYTAMTIAEYFRDTGKDVLLVLDDLTTHAKMYREISLLGRRTPGRNAYPGDIFYIHSRLLERAGNFKTPSGVHSITCLPVVEAPRGDITGYIQTNTISMTDGHIFFDYNLFVAGRRPAINPFLSVTRVGRQAQSPVRKEITQMLISFLSAAEKLHAFASFGAELTARVKELLDKESKILVLFDQLAYEVVPGNMQLYLFALLWNDTWKQKTADEMATDTHTLNAKYNEDAAFRNTVDTIVTPCKSLNRLLETIKEAQK